MIKYQCMSNLHELWKTMLSAIIQPEQDIMCDFIYTEWPEEAEKNRWLSRLRELEEKGRGYELVWVSFGMNKWWRWLQNPIICII